MASKRKITLNRRDVVARIVKDRGDTLVVTGLGSATWDAAAAGDHPNNFYLWGGMGAAAVTGLGLARAQPDRRVIVLTGDGEMLMGIGALATIAVAAPANLAVCVIDNQHYGETGMQEAHTSHGVDLAGMAAAAGFADTATVWTKKDVEGALPLLYETKGPVFVDIKVTTDPVPMILPMRDGTAIRARFRESVLGDRAYD
jgi:thiamine pyrophosphate-dependent acetolactate synthase large subunit-like protein